MPLAPRTLALPLALLVALAPPGPAGAEGPLALPVPAVLSLAEGAARDRAGFAADLAGVLPSARIDTASGPATAAAGGADIPAPDPFLWALGGEFGVIAPGRPRSGAIFACARYGLATRDLFAEHGFSDRQSFRLMQQALPLADDAAIWPEGAVARLHCAFTWDDAAQVAIVDLAEARAALGAAFATLARADRMGDGAGEAALFGEAGYRLRATGGRADSVVIVESGTITLTLGHQQVEFRSFLMGGGM